MKHVKMNVSTQTDYQNLRKKLVTNKMYILRKNRFKIDILCKIAFWNLQKWLNKIIYFNFLRNVHYLRK